MRAQMIIRVDDHLKQQASMLAKTEGKNISEVVRDLLEDYVQQRDLGAYVDSVWQNIGDKLRAKGRRLTDVARVIREVRKDKSNS